MRTFRASALISVLTAPVLIFGLSTGQAAAQAAAVVQAETALDAAVNMANILDGAGAGISGDAQISALETAAQAGQQVRVQVSYTDNRGSFESLTSAATAVVASAVIMGTNAANTLNGTALDDHILGLGGNDLVSGAFQRLVKDGF